MYEEKFKKAEIVREIEAISNQVRELSDSHEKTLILHKLQEINQLLKK